MNHEHVHIPNGLRHNLFDQSSQSECSTSYGVYPTAVTHHFGRTFFLFVGRPTALLLLDFSSFSLFRPSYNSWLFTCILSKIFQIIFCTSNSSLISSLNLLQSPLLRSSASTLGSRLTRSPFCPLASVLRIVP